MGSYGFPKPQQFQKILKAEDLSDEADEDDDYPRIPPNRGAYPFANPQQFNGTLNNDDSSEEDTDCSFDEELEDERDVLRPSTHTLGPNRNYVPRWTCEDAFRELYQNWKDALIASFDLDPRSFKPGLTRLRNQIQITVHREHATGSGRPSRELLGFIRYNKSAGSLELTNFRAELSLHHLSLGGTTKRGDQDRLAGVHGEGFKLAALVFRREEHAVRFAASSYYWNFGFRGVGDSLYCRLSHAKPEFVQRKKDAFARNRRAGCSRGLTANLWEDVTVKVSKGRGDSGKRISEDEFSSWLEVSLDLKGPQPADVVQTDQGDLILDKEFAGRIYLKGLRMPGQGAGGKHYIFGYNFIRGRINRDRERLVDLAEEAQMLAKIWEQSILRRGDDATDNYIKLFCHCRNCADIASAEETVSLVVAKAIWNQLRRALPNAFYYSEKNNSESDTDQTSIITSDLKKPPAKLPEALWNILRKFSLARTPKEERLHLFENSETIATNGDIFCVSILRALSACLSLDRRMEDIRIQFVEGGNIGIDLLFREDEKLLRIHAKWTSFQRIHEGTSCEASRIVGERPLEMEAFSCDHVVEDLFELILNSIRGPLQLDHSEAVTLRRLARERIQQIPRLVRVSRTGRGRELEVSWTGNESGLVAKRYGANLRYHVTLHKMSTCRSKKDDFLHQADTEPGSMTPGSNSNRTFATDAPCGCAHQIVSRSDAKAIFNELDHNEAYFPMVARVGNETFFGVPPAPVTPKAAPEINATPRPQITQAMADLAAQPPLEQREYIARHLSPGLFTSDDDDEDDNDNDDNEENAAVRIHTGISIPDTVRRRSQARSGQKLNESRNTDIIDKLAWENDEKTWQTWHEQDLPTVFSRLIPKREAKPLEIMSPISSLSCEHLEYTFEKDEFARVRLKSEGSLDFVILVHEIRRGNSCSDAKSYYLIVTKYSFLGSANPFLEQQSSNDNEMSMSNRELLLHFEDFGKMGKADDAEVIRLDDISHAEDLTSNSEILSDGVDHVVRPPSHLNHHGLFCRFAICNAVSPNTACITPIASGLLPHQNRWRQRRFLDSPQPLVFDLTPNVLGPSEGFLQAGCVIRAGFGFKPEHHATWRMRYPLSQVYDGSPLEVFDEFTLGKLISPTILTPDHPRIALSAGENTSFRLSDGNKQMPSVDEFLRPLDYVDAAANSPLRPDFLALLMPPAVLHGSTISRFSKSILKLLEQRFSVHIRLSSLHEYGIPQERSTLIVVASPLCASLPWHVDRPGTGPCPPIKDLIGDLVFENPRVTRGTNGGFVCSAPPQSNRITNEGSEQMKHVYNHQTGRPAPRGQTPIDMNATGVFVSRNSSKALVHPDRYDLLTIREIARIQGLLDDVVFYNSEMSQNKDVLNANPPIVSKWVAGIILNAMQSLRVVRLNDPGEVSRLNKRARVDNEG